MMGAVKDMWIAEHEAIPDQYTDDIAAGMSEAEAKDNARAKLRALGFDPHEIEEQIAELEG